MKNNFYISFGVWLVILPFLGIPGLWKSALTVLSGLFLIIISLGSIWIKKSQFKGRTKKKFVGQIIETTPVSNIENQSTDPMDTMIEVEKHEN